MPDNIIDGAPAEHPLRTSADQDLDTWDTDDLYLASYARLRGLTLLGATVGRGGHATWTFQDASQRPQIEIDWIEDTDRYRAFLAARDVLLAYADIARREARPETLAANGQKGQNHGHQRFPTGSPGRGGDGYPANGRATSRLPSRFRTTA